MAVTIEEFMIDVTTRMSGNDANNLAKVGDMARGLLSTFGRLIGISGGIYGVGAAIHDFVTDAVDLKRVSDVTNSSVENVSAWVDAMNGAGENGSRFLGTVKSLSSGIQDAFTGMGSSITPFFTELGVALLDQEGNLRDTTEIIKDLAYALEPFSPEKQQKIADMLGIDDSTLRFLQRGGDAVTQMLEAQKALFVVTGQQAEASKRIQETYYNIQQEWSAFSNKRVSGFLPGVQDILDILLLISKWVNENEQTVVRAVTAIVGVLMLKLVPALLAVAVSWMLAMAPVLLVIALLSVLGAALLYLIDDFLAWKDGGVSAFGGFWEAVYPIIKKIEDAFLALKEFLLRVWEDPKGTWNDTINYFKERWKNLSLLEIGEDIITSLGVGIRNIWNSVIIPFLRTAHDYIKSEFGIDLIAEGEKALKSLWEGMKAGYAYLETFFSDLLLKIQGMFVTDEFRNIGKKAGDTIVNAISDAFDWLSSPESIDWLAVGNMLIDGFKSIGEVFITFAGAVTQTIQGFIESIISGMWAGVKRGFKEVFTYVGLGDFFDKEQSDVIPEGISVPNIRGMPGPIGGFGASSLPRGTESLDRYVRGGDVNVGKIDVYAPGGTKESLVNGLNATMERLRQKAFTVADSSLGG